MNKVKFEINESELENEMVKASYINMWAILLDFLTEEEQESIKKDYNVYRNKMNDKQLKPLDAYVWGLLNFNIQVGYESK